MDGSKLGAFNEPIILIIIYSNPAKIKTTAPTISYFQEIIKTARRINTGILCINNPPAQLKKLLHKSKTSQENIDKNSKNKIHNIRGVQNINLLTFCLLLFFSILNLILYY